VSHFDELKRVLELHQRTYKLFRWMAERVRTQTLNFSVLHRDASTAEAAEEWIRRNHANLPADARPEPSTESEFARLLASYLSTSFEPVEVKERLVSSCGCYCACCAYLANAPALKARKISSAAQRDARKLIELFCVELASGDGIPFTAGDAIRFIEDCPELLADLQLGAYCRELLRRSKFASQGAGVYALWREIAWENGRPRRGFRIVPETVAAGEQRILERMGATSAGR
jgi:hypothetical protein